MEIKSITRNKEYASWTVTYIHEGIEHTVVVNLNSKTSLLESLDNTKIVPPFAADLIRDELADKCEITKGFFDEAFCEVRPEDWTR
jgi:hypothetical protein